MNKKYKLILLSFITVAITIFSCRKDNSTLDLEKIPGVIIDTAGAGTLSVFQFDHLVVKPVLKMEGVSEADLTFSWKINLTPTDTIYEVIGEGRDLDAEIRFKPNATGYYHQLLYTITDKKTGLEYIMAWPLTIKNNIGEGLVVAETSDNTNTDLSHIMAPEVTSNYTGESVKHHVYSSINGSHIAGLVKQMRYAPVFGVNALFAITDNSMVRVNTLDYTYHSMNNDLFFSPRENLKPQALGALYQGDVYIGEGKLTATNLGITRKFGLPYDFKFNVPGHVALNGNSANAGGSDRYTPAVSINFYDEVNGHFVYLPTILQFGGDNTMHAYLPATDKAFNPGNLPGKVNLAAGISVDRGFLHLLKDKTSGAVALYIFDAGKDNYPNPLTPPSPLAVYDLSNAPGINNATKFVLLDDQKVMYYATGNKIYAMLYGTSTPVFEERYTVPAGEEITTLQIYRQVGYPLQASYIETNNKQLIMSTYGSEGKVYLLPITNPGLGNIDNANVKTFGGFGRITAIAPQK